MKQSARQWRARRGGRLVWGIGRASIIASLLCMLIASSPLRQETVRTFSETGHTLSGQFLAYWEQNDGPRTLGPPLSAAIWLDERKVQFFAGARLEEVSPPNLSTAVVSQTLGGNWQATLPPDLFARPAASQRATLIAPAAVEPLSPIQVTLTIPGYSGQAEVRLYDGVLRPAGVWFARLRKGKTTLQIEGRGALGPHPAVVLIDGRVAGARTNLFTLDAQTAVQTGQPRFDKLYQQGEAFMRQDTLTYDLGGARVHGYRSSDSNLLWLRDHVYQARAARYFDPDMTSLIDAFRRAQNPDGSFPDYLAYPQHGIPAQRLEAEADVEFLFVQAVYQAWQATGDDAWLRSNLDAMRLAIRYTMSDPLRWDAEKRLVRRPFTIDMWDFQYGPTTVDPLTGRPAPRHWIDDHTVWGIFHGDNTGLAGALLMLAQMEEQLGDPAMAARWRAEARGIMERLNALSWNGRFFTHHVHTAPASIPGIDESRQLSLSNAVALNRRVLTPEQGRAIVDAYFQRFQQRGKTFAEWYSIDPPFPPGSFGLGGRLGENPGEYVNGGIMPLVGGELARGAFRHGAEQYGFDILARYHFLISSTRQSYLWYYPAGNPGKSGHETLPTDGWGTAAMLGALIEGAAGIEDRGARYQEIVISPRWTYATDVRTARVVVRYAASGGYVAYTWQRHKRAILLDFTSPASHAQVRLLLPQGQQVTAVTVDGQPHAYDLDDVFGSRYVTLDLPAGNGVVAVQW